MQSCVSNCSPGLYVLRPSRQTPFTNEGCFDDDEDDKEDDDEEDDDDDEEDDDKEDNEDNHAVDEGKHITLVFSGYRFRGGGTP